MEEEGGGEGEGGGRAECQCEFTCTIREELARGGEEEEGGGRGRRREGPLDGPGGSIGECESGLRSQLHESIGKTNVSGRQADEWSEVRGGAEKRMEEDGGGGGRGRVRGCKIKRATM